MAIPGLIDIKARTRRRRYPRNPLLLLAMQQLATCFCCLIVCTSQAAGKWIAGYSIEISLNYVQSVVDGTGMGVHHALG